MPEFDIDNLKKEWQKEPPTPKYADKDILEMLNLRSRNYVKYIFYISLVEFLFILVLNIYYLFKENNYADLIHLMERLGASNSEAYRENFNLFYNIAKFSSLLITFYFVIKFYLSYKRIHIEQSLKDFILHIMKFRKTVNLFILLNIFLMILFLGLFTVFVLVSISFENVAMDKSTIIGFVTGIVVSSVLSVVLLWIYYRVIYGILMGRLGRNLNQLKEIEKNNSEN